MGQELILSELFSSKRHARQAASYEPGARLYDWHSRDWPTWESAERVRTILDSRLFHKVKKTGVIISPSANSGRAEDAFQQALGETYTVIAGDLARLPHPENAKAARVRLDASRLPFKDNTADVIYDTRGALCYEALYDRSLKTGELTNTQLLMQEYQRVLVPGGIVVVDDEIDASYKFSNHTQTTAELFRSVTYQNPQFLGFSEPKTLCGVAVNFLIYTKI